MDPTPFFIMGTIFGAGSFWLIQIYGRRKVKQGRTGSPDANRAVELLSTENERQMKLISRLEERISVMERIATDEPARLGYAIDALR